jgi:hypothetical protein
VFFPTQSQDRNKETHDAICRIILHRIHRPSKPLLTGHSRLLLLFDPISRVCWAIWVLVACRLLGQTCFCCAQLWGKNLAILHCSCPAFSCFPGLTIMSGWYIFQGPGFPGLPGRRDFALDSFNLVSLPTTTVHRPP